jgi:hypothetical protein
MSSGEEPKKMLCAIPCRLNIKIPPPLQQTALTFIGESTSIGPRKRFPNLDDYRYLEIKNEGEWIR